jgi:hypothetical protein
MQLMTKNKVAGANFPIKSMFREVEKEILA